MKLLIAAASAALITAGASAAAATPSLAYADTPHSQPQAEFIDAKFKFKKLGGHRGFRRGHFGHNRFGHRGFSRFGHSGKGFVVKKASPKFFFGKGFFIKK